MGIEVLGPNVNESQVNFAPAPKSQGASQEASGLPPIRFGLAAIKGIGEVAVHAMLKARQEGGRFTSLTEMCERLDGRTMNRKVLEALIKTGACDDFGKTRAALFSQIERTLARATSVIADRQRGQAALFGMVEDRSTSNPDAALDLAEWPEQEKLHHEKELLGFYVSGHPLMPLEPLLDRYSLANTKTLAQLPNRSMTRVGGMIATASKAVSKKTGKNYALATLEDLHGSVQVLCINESYDKFVHLLEVRKPVMIIGEVNAGDEQPKLFPQEIFPLEDAPRRYTRQVHLRLKASEVTPEKLDQLSALLEAHRGKCPLLLCFAQPGNRLVYVGTHDRFNVVPSLALQHAVDEMFGRNTYYAKVDTALPERTARRWERKGANGGDDE
jgi:DNA polymerase-3 subunit alpha